MSALLSNIASAERRMTPAELYFWAQRTVVRARLTKARRHSIRRHAKDMVAKGRDASAKEWLDRIRDW